MTIFGAILPAAIGLLFLLKPETLFIGSKATPTPQKLESIRKAGKMLLFAATGLATLSIISNI